MLFLYKHRVTLVSSLRWTHDNIGVPKKVRIFSHTGSDSVEQVSKISEGIARTLSTLVIGLVVAKGIFCWVFNKMSSL